MTRLDSGTDRPPRIVIELTGRGHHPGAETGPALGAAPVTDTVVDLAVAAESRREVVRIRAADLGAAQRICADIRSDVAACGRDPDSVSVLVDIAVMVAADAPTARRRLTELNRRVADSWQPPSLLYVGTPTGLAGLIADMHTVGIGDGVTLLPLSLPDVVGPIVYETIPWLTSLGAVVCEPGVRTLREYVAQVRRPAGVRGREITTQLA